MWVERRTKRGSFKAGSRGSGAAVGWRHTSSCCESLLVHMTVKQRHEQGSGRRHRQRRQRCLRSRCTAWQQIWRLILHCPAHRVGVAQGPAELELCQGAVALAAAVARSHRCCSCCLTECRSAAFKHSKSRCMKCELSADAEGSRPRALPSAPRPPVQAHRAAQQACPSFLFPFLGEPRPPRCPAALRALVIA